MPPTGTPPNPWKLTTEHGELLVYQDESYLSTSEDDAFAAGDLALCDRRGSVVPSDHPDVAGIVVHPETARAMWRAAKSAGE